MKKRLFFCAFFFCTVFFCHAAQYFAGEGVEDLAVMHDFNGGAYVLYVQNGSLKALHENPDDSLTECLLPEAARNVQNIASLTMHEEAGFPFGIIATNDGHFYIIKLDIDFEEKAGVFHFFPFLLPSDAADMFYEELINGDIRIWYISKSTLFCQNLNGNDCSVITDTCIREGTGRVYQYGIKRFESTTKGYYISQNSSSEYTVSFFSQSDNLYMFYDIQRTFTEKPEVQEICTGKNSFYFCVTDGKQASLYNIDSGNLTYVTLKNIIKKVYSFNIIKTADTEYCFLDYIDASDLRHVYYGTGGVCSFESVITDAPVFVLLSEDKAGIIYGCEKNWKLVSFPLNNENTNDNLVSNMAAESDMLCCTYAGELCSLFRNKESKHMQYVCITEKGAVQSFTVPLSETVQKQMSRIAVSVGRCIFTGTDEIIIDYPGSAMLVFNKQNTSFEVVSCTESSYAGNCNGLFFASCYSNAKIIVHKIGERNE
jgi:hypothetical protein